jgi:hypothetical protein
LARQLQSALVPLGACQGRAGKKVDKFQFSGHNDQNSAHLGGPNKEDKTMAMTKQEYEAEIARLTAQLEANKKGRKVSLKVGEKGGVSVYGLGRFPVTLYKEQMKKFLDAADEIRAFIVANDHLLKNKD